MLVPVAAHAAALSCPVAVRPTYVTTFAPVRPTPVHGPSDTQTLLDLYGVGHGVMQLFGHAASWASVRWIRLHAAHGNPAAQHLLGVMYVQGRGVTQDDARAVQWFDRAALQGDVGAENDLGVMYAQGRGVPQSYGKAEEWFAAAARSLAPAQFNLGVTFEYGRGVPADPARALTWYRRAAGQGFVPAQRALGMLYTGGHGIAQDTVAAYTWDALAKAASRPNSAGYRCVDKAMVALGATMTPIQLATAQRDAEAWWRAHHKTRLY
jgi:TPR repeat protein